LETIMADLSLGAQCAPGNAFALPYPLTRTAIENHVEALIAVLDSIDGDFDQEEDDEDCCLARDDTGGYHPNDGYGDGLPGDPADREEDDSAEDSDPDCCNAGDDGVFSGSMLLPVCDEAAGDPEDAEPDHVHARSLKAARERLADKRLQGGRNVWFG
jgi:hypothetical protein